MPGFWIACLLMPINWGFEAKKWQLLLKPLQYISLFTAFKSVLAGCSITMLTPNRIGEYGGRILYVDEDKRLDAIPLTILGSISQLFITLIMGITGIILLKNSGHTQQIFSFLPAYSINVLLGISIVAATFLLLLYSRVGIIVKWMGTFKALQKVVSHVILLNSFSRKQLLNIIILSFLRYMVFILQYVLLLKVMQVNIDLATMAILVSVFYIIMAMAPTIGFTELPIRASISVQVFQLYSNNTLGIQAGALGIWGINLVLPAIIGSLLIIGLKILKDK